MAAGSRPTIINARGTPWQQHWREITQRPELLRALLRRDFKVRYAQTRLGTLWALLQPLLTLGVLYVVFSEVLRVNTDPLPYPLFALSGIVVWNYFNYVVSQSASALIHAQNVIRKIYFPRVMLGLSKALVGSIDFIIGTALLLAWGLASGQVHGQGLLLIPLVWAATGLAGLGLGLGISALSIRYRDLQQILPFLLQLLFFLSPVAYGMDFFLRFVGKEQLALFYLNPVSGLIELWRSLLFGQGIPAWWWLSPLAGLLLLFLALAYFHRTEKKLADLI